MEPANSIKAGKARGRMMLQALSPVPPTGTVLHTSQSTHLKCCHSHLSSNRIAAVGAAMLATADGQHDLRTEQDGSCRHAHQSQGAGSALRPIV